MKTGPVVCLVNAQLTRLLRAAKAVVQLEAAAVSGSGGKLGTSFKI